MKMIRKMEMRLITLKERVKNKVTENSGQGALDTAVQILIAVVLGALILAGLYAILDGEVLPALSEKITEMFNYSN